MSYIIENKVGGHIYLYECVSFRENGKVKSHRRTIGKVDPLTGERHYKAEYLERMRQAGTPVENAPSAKAFSRADLEASSVLSCGAFHLLKALADKSGLTASLEQSLPGCWQEVFMLALHLLLNGEPLMRCAQWLEGTESYPVASLSSQRLSELLAAITPDMREDFYRSWCKRRLEEEYLALDITSVSSYSELVDDVEWGYNRDGEDLPQINICLLMGEKSKLPVYQTVYAGSLNDVRTLDVTVRRFDRITGGKPILTVMDKGFYSKGNVSFMLSGQEARKFILAVPFTSAFANAQIESERKDIDRVEKTIRLGDKTLRAVTKERVWANGSKVFTHIYFTPSKALNRREDIFGHISFLREEAEADPERCLKSPEHKKYLSIRKSKKSPSGYIVSIRQEQAQAALGTQGWLVLISNDIAEAKEAIQIYRAKDVVEKGFLRLKSDLELGRLRVHSQDRMQNKVFIGFIALVLSSMIHAVMTDKKLYAQMTMNQLLRSLVKHRAQYIAGERIVFPATKNQRQIYEAFNVDIPA